MFDLFGRRAIARLTQERDEARSIAERQLARITGLKLLLAMAPDPSYRRRRYGHLSPERQTRFLDTIASLGTAGGSAFLKELHNGKKLGQQGQR